MSSQLDLWSEDVSAPAWAHEGMACERCAKKGASGHLYMVHASEACGCSLPVCGCLAEGYARCDTCGALRQVWPREMKVQFAAVARSA
jgi:hypothetical protein